MPWLPDVIALSITKTSKMNRKGATANRMMVELLFRNATLAAQQNNMSRVAVCWDSLLPQQLSAFRTLLVVQQSPELFEESFIVRRLYEDPSLRCRSQISFGCFSFWNDHLLRATQACCALSQLTA